MVWVEKDKREVNMVYYVLRGKFLMFPNRIWGSQAETRRWALEMKPKGFQCHVSPPKQEMEVAS